ncbi:hypothetical protein BKK81_05380 [Cupriavidus sp. USMAHM13]|uniref:hypothetical protein n=1 Tax=Cupriavidus sp. USMAHM13 TaxID=1389192 RepID=UPI0008A6D4BC|nr:hypothetical protein [Cupriavidus sp. USMAHM13]AOY98775.1 hypothetical protein BKK81_05380 [Cupriavidus sp. USMAHM13]
MEKYYQLGAQCRAAMPSISDRFAAYRAATGQDSDMSELVTVTVKEVGGAPVALTMTQDAWIAFVAGFAPM